MNYRLVIEKIKYNTREDLDRFFTMLYTTGPVCDCALFSLMDYFGLRASKVGLIGSDHIDLNRPRIWITRLKGGISAEYPLPRTARLSRRLQVYLYSRGLHHPNVLFLSRLKRPISRNHIDVLVKKYCRKAKLPVNKHQRSHFLSLCGCTYARFRFYPRSS